MAVDRKVIDGNEYWVCRTFSNKKFVGHFDATKWGLGKPPTGGSI